MLGTKYCISIPDHPKNIGMTLTHMTSEIAAIEQLTGDPLQEWWASLGST